MNPIQLARFVLLTIVTAPPNYVWQQYLERTFPAYARSVAGDAANGDGHNLEKGGVGQDGLGRDAGSKPKLNMRNTMTKWFMDCIVLGAILNTVAFLILMGLMKGQTLDMIGQTVRTVCDESAGAP